VTLSPGLKFDNEKCKPFSFFLSYFPRATCAVADVGAAGTAKYAYRGWTCVPDGIARYSDALIRHELEIAKHSPFHRDSELRTLHAAQVAWNALARLELILIEMEGEGR
jgi:hypothetical protein